MAAVPTLPAPRMILGVLGLAIVSKLLVVAVSVEFSEIQKMIDDGESFQRWPTAYIRLSIYNLGTVLVRTRVEEMALGG